MDCYAAPLGDCAGGGSGEHYISRSVLELVGTAVRGSGFPWQAQGTRQDIGIASLSANILCRRHNQQLWHLDETGKMFVRALKTIHDNAAEGHDLRMNRSQSMEIAWNVGYSRYSAGSLP